MTNFLIRQPLNDLSKVSNEMGYRETHPITGKSSPHYGIDLVPSGDRSVFAAHDGKVIVSGTQVDSEGNPTGYGNYIVVKADDGRKTLYAHLSKRLVSVGQKIGTGSGEVTQIGIAGSSGSSSGVHLHFEVFEANGKKSNPRTYLAEAFPDTFSKTVNTGTELTGETTGDTRDNTMVANSNQNTLIGLDGTDTYSFDSLSGADEITEANSDGLIQIGGVYLSGNAKPKTDSSGNIIENQWISADGYYDLTRDGDIGYFYFSLKFTTKLLKKFTVFFAAVFLLMSNPLLAADSTISTQTKITSINQSKVVETAELDDSKLSITELRKKYPITLILRKDKIKSSDQILGYSVDQIKSVFLNTEKNFLRKKESKNNITAQDDVEVSNPEELKIIGDICKYLTSKPTPHLSYNQEKLSLFIFSDKIQKHLYPFLSSEIQKCFFENDPYEDRN